MARRRRDEEVEGARRPWWLRLGEDAGNPGLAYRLRESFPLLAIGFAFLAGALVASLGHWRVFNSIYPLWVLFAINGVVAAGAGSAALFVEEPDRPIDNDPNVVRVPRVQWEALLRRLDSASRATLERSEQPEWAEPSMPSLAAAPAMSPPAPEARTRRGPGGRRTVVVTPAAPPPEPLVPPPQTPAPAHRKELESLEVQGIAESALATAEALGPSELGALIRTSGPELASIAERWDIPGPSTEGPDALLARLLRELAASKDQRARRPKTGGAGGGST